MRHRNPARVTSPRATWTRSSTRPIRHCWVAGEWTARSTGPPAGSSLTRAVELRRTEFPHGLPVGAAVATPGFKLPARWVIHTVGPNRHAGQNRSGTAGVVFPREPEGGRRPGCPFRCVPRNQRRDLRLGRPPGRGSSVRRRQPVRSSNLRGRNSSNLLLLVRRRRDVFRTCPRLRYALGRAFASGVRRTAPQARTSAVRAVRLPTSMVLVIIDAHELHEALGLEIQGKAYGCAAVVASFSVKDPVGRAGPAMTWKSSRLPGSAAVIS